MYEFIDFRVVVGPYYASAVTSTALYCSTPIPLRPERTQVIRVFTSPQPSRNTDQTESQTGTLYNRGDSK
jgi:hypothetical protein